MLIPSHLHSIIILVQHLPLPSIMTSTPLNASRSLDLSLLLLSNKPSYLISNTSAGGQEGMKTPPSSRIPSPDVTPQLDLTRRLDRGQGIDASPNKPVPGNLYPAGMSSTFTRFDDLLRVSAIGWRPFISRSRLPSADLALPNPHGNWLGNHGMDHYAPWDYQRRDSL